MQVCAVVDKCIPAKITPLYCQPVTSKSLTGWGPLKIGKGVLDGGIYYRVAR